MPLTTKTIPTSGLSFLKEGSKILSLWEEKKKEKTEVELIYKDYPHSPYFGDVVFLMKGPLESYFHIPASGFPKCCGGVLLSAPVLYYQTPYVRDLAKSVLNVILSKHSLVYLGVDLEDKTRGMGNFSSILKEFRQHDAWKGQYGEYKMKFFIREKQNFLPYEINDKVEEKKEAVREERVN